MRKAFTLVDIMIVVATVGILFAISVPQFLKAKARTAAAHPEARACVPAAYAQPPAARDDAAVVETPAPVPRAPAAPATTELVTTWSGGCIHMSAPDGNSQTYYHEQELGLRNDGVVVWRRRPDWAR